MYKKCQRINMKSINTWIREWIQVGTSTSQTEKWMTPNLLNRKPSEIMEMQIKPTMRCLINRWVCKNMTIASVKQGKANMLMTCIPIYQFQISFKIFHGFKYHSPKNKIKNKIKLPTQSFLSLILFCKYILKALF